MLLINQERKEIIETLGGKYNGQEYSACSSKDRKCHEDHFGVIKFPFSILHPYFLSKLVQILNKIYLYVDQFSKNYGLRLLIGSKSVKRMLKCCECKCWRRSLIWVLIRLWNKSNTSSLIKIQISKTSTRLGLFMIIKFKIFLDKTLVRSHHKKKKIMPDLTTLIP